MIQRVLSIITVVIATTVVLTGCGSKTAEPANVLEQKQLDDKVEHLRDRSDDYSKWYVDQDDRVPLTIVGIGYVDPRVKQTKEYKRYKNFLAMLQKDPSKISLLLSEEVTEKFYPIRIVDFESDEDSLLKFSAVY
ncbi:MAG: hypothetical protein GXO11_03210, partial [Epsilonproteobacteria bacterium]|nr:hypothetical protein [Campylobacterota bacterium]